LAKPLDNQARRQSLDNFLKKYSRSDELPPEERAERETIQEQLWYQDAIGELASLERHLPGGNVARWQEAHRIREKYATTRVREQVRKAARSWLDTSLPAKAVRDSGGLQEIKARQPSGKPVIYRYYFKESTMPDGNKEYKRYRSAEERRNPTSQVGSILQADIIWGPRTPTPEYCAERYNDGRAALLAQPDDKARWRKFVELCYELQQELSDYLKTEGHGPVDVSFEQEAEFARQLLDQKTWPMVETVLRPAAVPLNPSKQR
jgi:hypothetical protein